MEKISPLTAYCYEPLLGSLLKNMRQEVYSLIQELYKTSLPYAPLTYVDCCCGAGGFIQSVHKKSLSTSYQMKIIGIDYNITMLNRAKKDYPQNLWIQGNAQRLPFTTQSIDIVTICMALHTISEEQGRNIMHELSRVAKNVIVADYCLAERNLSLPATFLAHSIEALIGGEHYQNYKIFMKNGAIEGFLQRCQQTAHTRRSVLGGAGTVILLT